ncbi:phosphoserine phosphatase SerB [Haloparvum alkalitolerans]|uniref:phosphoserine phosphatase SerB n=1 Tax=Haloparvum alkalitolerans TaxID=1042953 RepID=UPI003CEDFA29
MKLIAFDFDGTLSDSEMTVLLAERAGVADEVADITERAMNDELSYAESLYRRAELLQGLSAADVEAAFDEVRIRPGAAALIERLQAEGHHVAVLTGGFERGVAAALEKEGVEVDTIVANRLPTDAAGALTGEADGPLIEGTKDDALADLSDEVGVPLASTVAVGDGANDLPMLEVAGLSVGFAPKRAVRPVCDAVVASMFRLGKVFEGYRVLPKED